VPFVDAVLGWVVRESSAAPRSTQRPAQLLRLRWVDAALFIAAVLPALAL